MGDKNNYFRPPICNLTKNSEKCVFRNYGFMWLCVKYLQVISWKVLFHLCPSYFILEFPSRELPPVFKLSVSTLCGEYFVPSFNYSGYYFYLFHIVCSVMYSYKLFSTGVCNLYPISTAEISSVPGIMNSWALPSCSIVPRK